MCGELVLGVRPRGHGHRLYAERGPALDVGRGVADDDDLLAGEAPARELLGAPHGHGRQTPGRRPESEP